MSGTGSFSSWLLPGCILMCFLSFHIRTGAGMCSVDPKEVLEQCKEISAIAWQSACHACDLFDEQGTVETFNKKLSKK
jgi:hypothetical protein